MQRISGFSLSAHPDPTWTGTWTKALAAALLLAVALLLWADGIQAGTTEAPWKLRIKEAASVAGPKVLLGEIAEPIGELDPRKWDELAATELWPSPSARSRPLAVNKDKLQKVLKHFLGDVASLCVLPPRLVLKRGGVAYDEQQLRQIVVNTLTPLLSGLDGEASLREFQLPSFLFLNDPNNSLKVQPSGDVGPGRLGMRLMELDTTGRTRRSVSAGVFVDLWKEVPAAARPLNRNESLTPELITSVRKNMAYLRSGVWDGLGGPWRVKNPIGAMQVVYASSLEPLPEVRKGDTVTLVYEGSRIRLSTTAEALADGGRGESILVRNMQSGREVSARVRNADTVSVQ
jgi:flagellar basal body P-ring formation protein FlgA